MRIRGVYKLRWAAPSTRVNGSVTVWRAELTGLEKKLSVMTPKLARCALHLKRRICEFRTGSG